MNDIIDNTINMLCIMISNGFMMVILVFINNKFVYMEYLVYIVLHKT